MKRAAIYLLTGLLALQLAGCGNGDRPAEEERSTESVSEEESREPESEPEPEPESSQSEPAADAPSVADIAPEPAVQPAQPVNGETSAQPEASEAATDGTGNPFALDPAGNYGLYAYDPANWTYTTLNRDVSWPEGYYTEALERREAWTLVIQAVNSLPTLSTTTAADQGPVGGFMTMDMSGSYAKVQYLLKPGNILEVDGTAYAMTQEQYDSLYSVWQTAVNQDERGAQWLIYMNPTRVTGIQCHDENGELQTMKAENVPLAAGEPGYINVYSGKTYNPAGVSLDGWYIALYTFDNGIQYTVAVKDNLLRVQSSDMSFGCEYVSNAFNIDSFITYNQEAIDGPMNPRTGKPVIYLYPDKTRDVEVKLDFRGQLFYTYPTYNDGWRVTAKPDGTLTNKADGSTHYYLFWDGTADRDTWDFSTGFVVKGSETESFLREKLPLLGLTPREYNDFIVYWVPEMKGNPYNLITFNTEQYEEVARLDITPQPDTVLRVHMIYMPVYEEMQIKEPVLPATPARKGFTVVEWGGTRA